MLTVDDFGQIRRAHRDGMTIRAIARRLYHSRRKLREALACVKERARTSASHAETIGDRFGRDCAAALPLPVHRFDPCVHQAAVADMYETVRCNGNRYSVIFAPR